jgi:hypothetical protein
MISAGMRLSMIGTSSLAERSSVFALPGWS